MFAALDTLEGFTLEEEANDTNQRILEGPH